MIRAYLKIHRRGIVVFALSCAITAVIFALYRIPLAAVAYAAAICVFFAGIILATDYWAFALKHRELSVLLDGLRRTEAAQSGEAQGTAGAAGIDTGAALENLPLASGRIEEDYQALLRATDDGRRMLQEEMERRFREMTDYYTMWVHQIKTPISALRLMLQENPRPEFSEELQRIEQYVEMVLCYLRLDADSTDYVFRECDLDAIVRQAVRRNASAFIRRKLKLEYEPLHTRVVTDEKWLLFVIEQVLSNALKYTPEGSVSITLEAPKTLCIRDTGIGITPEDLPRIFEKGYTGDNGRSDKRASGIGMYLCSRICANLGHGIRVDAAPGRGTEVRIDLKSAELEVE